MTAARGEGFFGRTLGNLSSAWRDVASSAARSVGRGARAGAGHDGEAFEPVASSDTTKTLRSVWGSGPGDLWAVGKEGTLVHYELGEDETRLRGRALLARDATSAGAP